jgi:hypothetical protein
MMMEGTKETQRSRGNHFAGFCLSVGPGTGLGGRIGVTEKNGHRLPWGIIPEDSPSLRGSKKNVKPPGKIFSKKFFPVFFGGET